ncbi:MAG: hypothetical protein FWF18_04680 [Dehalococcoidia bacterium]|nr:hypothetical protein [Dehalococcoidia bacterium]
MKNLRIAMILFGAIQIAEGAVALFAPAMAAGYLGIEDFDLLHPVMIARDLTNFAAYIMAFLGATLISAGFLFIIGGLNPYRNVNAVRFAILWSGLSLVAQIYSIVNGYTTFGTIWLAMVITIVFLIAFILFFPWPFNRDSYR